MIELINRNPVIADYLSVYPRSQWKDCLEYTLVIEIQTLQAHFAESLSIDTLRQISQNAPLPLTSQMPYITAKLESMKEELNRINKTIEPKHTHRSSSLNKTKQAKKPKRTHEPIKKHNRESPKPPFKSSSHPKGVKQRKLPKHLQKVDSKIKENVRRDRLEWNFSSRNESGVLGIADEFLKNPLISQLSHSQKEINIDLPKLKHKDRYADLSNSEERNYSEISLSDL